MPMSKKVPARLAAPIVKSNAKRPTKNTIDETRTSVSGTDALQSSQVETIDISSDPDSDEDLSEDENEEADAIKAEEVVPLVNGKQNTGTKAEDAESDEEPTSPSFGELLRGNEAIDVTAMLQQPAAANNTVARTERTAIVPPTHQSLVTVLSQALSTDDTDLLESCLHTTDLLTIRNTIERIDSSLAGILLNKLAARLHRRPGRAGTLMTWVQWTLIAHGGALASQTKVVHSLSSLQKVLADRAKGLNSLLALKGKLDILEGQMELRRKMQSSKLIGQDDDDAEEEEDVIYVEGEEHDVNQKDLANGVRSRRRRAGGDDDDDDVVLANGFVGDSEDEEQDSDDAGEESDDAEEALDEDEVNYDDVDESMGEDEESDVEAAPPTKVQKVGSFGKKK
ncbi:U3 small nucleolar RNA-associated protein 5 [Cladobotryum mycophilum]|uniref:U3 small nucleolar RNA-associated protein 5 n=1 Tax=Cladobotryum mycophilum TaxID=491253 RepID=A0ABR0SAU7_9HYPO